MEELVFEAGGREYSLSDVTSVNLAPNVLGAKETSARGTRDLAARDVVAAIFRGPAMDMSVAIAGMVTGTIEIEFRGGERAVFDVYNDRLAVDRQSRTGYYITTGYRSIYALLP
jgi:hypothetical protein